MRRKVAFLTGLLAVAAVLTIVTAPRAKACEAGGKLQFVLTGCFDADGKLHHYSNNCDPGSRDCNDNVC